MPGHQHHHQINAWPRSRQEAPDLVDMLAAHREQDHRAQPAARLLELPRLLQTPHMPGRCEEAHDAARAQEDAPRNLAELPGGPTLAATAAPACPPRLTKAWSHGACDVGAQRR